MVGSSTIGLASGPVQCAPTPATDLALAGRFEVTFRVAGHFGPVAAADRSKTADRSTVVVGDHAVEVAADRSMVVVGDRAGVVGVAPAPGDRKVAAVDRIVVS